MSNAERFVNFLNQSHSQFQAVAQVERELRDAGFIKLKENSTWNLENNRFYYVIKNQSTIIAFKIPEIINVRSLNIAASHSDSPSLKVKPVSMIKDANYGRLNVEPYGGAILSTWLDRPLSIAGRVTVKENGDLINKLIDLQDYTVIIPNVPIHFNRQLNDGYKYNPQVDLIPLTSDCPQEKEIEKVIARKLNCETEDILGTDLYLYDKVEARLWGENREFVSGQKIDNLESVFTSLEAFLRGYSTNSINILAVFDNEEVGSATKQGAGSLFLRDVIDRIFASFFYSGSDVKAILANSFLMSCDNSHALHPNHPEYYDVENRVYLNKGVVLKSAARMSYISDSQSIAIVRQLAQRSDVPVQMFANKSDSRGGGTLGPKASTTVPISGVDIGLAQLAMHSCYETAGSKDIDYMIDLLQEFYNSTIIMDDAKATIHK